VSIYQYYFCAPTIDAPEIDENLEVNIFPNPASDKLLLETSGFKKIDQILIYSIEGKLLNTIHCSDKEGVETIDISNFSSGVYFYEIESGNKILRGRFMKN
jgi:hypothetical protein